MNTVKAGYHLAFSKHAWRMPLVWIPVLVTLATSWIAYMMPDPPAGGTIDLKTLDPDQKRHSRELLVLAPVQLLFMLALNISWLRYIVRGEAPSGAYFGGALWRYMSFSIIFVLGFTAAIMAVMLPAAMILLPGTQKTPLDAAMIFPALVIGVIVGGIALWLFTRCILKFTGIGVDDSTMTLQRSWRLMQGHTLAYIAGGFLAIGPFALLSYVIGLLQKHAAGESLGATLILNGLVGGCLGVAQMLVSASFYGLAYRHIVTGPYPARGELA